MNPLFRALLIVVCCLDSHVTAAQSDNVTESVENRESRFSADISVGIEFDGNISVNELDSNTSEDDFAAILDVDLGYDVAIGEKTDLDFGYRFSQSLHDEFEDFDIQAHFASINLSHDFDALKAGVAYRYVDTLLDKEGLLELQQVSPYVSKFFGKRIFVRADYAYTDKKFDDGGLRSATVDTIGASVYWLINGLQTYIVVGYKYEDEDADGSQFEYQANSFRLRFAQRFALGSRYARFRLGWRYEDRDYDAITPQIGEIRDDQRHRFQAELEIPIAKRAYASIEYGYSDFSSNLPSADYDQSVASVKLGMRF